MITLYRPITTLDDRKFVVSAWSSSYKRSHYAGIISSDDWSTIMHGQIGKLLDRPTTRTIIAYSPPSLLVGFICGDTSEAIPVVHYVYVKDPYRSELLLDSDGNVDETGPRTGPRHARALFGQLGVDPARPFIYTCRTFVALQMRDKIPLARFAPGAARYTNYQSQERR